jgi:hypothetical protein
MTNRDDATDDRLQALLRALGNLDFDEEVDAVLRKRGDPDYAHPSNNSSTNLLSDGDEISLTNWIRPRRSGSGRASWSQGSAGGRGGHEDRRARDTLLTAASASLRSKRTGFVGCLSVTPLHHLIPRS